MLAKAVSAYRDALGARLIAGYALGSLAHGGFSQLVSDVDLGLILQDPNPGERPHGHLQGGPLPENRGIDA